MGDIFFVIFMEARFVVLTLLSPFYFRKFPATRGVQTLFGEGGVIHCNSRSKSFDFHLCSLISMDFLSDSS